MPVITRRQRTARLDEAAAERLPPSVVTGAGRTAVVLFEFELRRLGARLDVMDVEDPGAAASEETSNRTAMAVTSADARRKRAPLRGVVESIPHGSSRTEYYTGVRMSKRGAEPFTAFGSYSFGQ